MSSLIPAILERGTPKTSPSVMSPTFDLITTSYRGGTGGGPFDDRGNPGDLSTPVITKIIVWHTSLIVGLQIQSEGKIHCHGRDGGSKSLLEFETGEFVKRIEGRSDLKCIIALTFITNKRIYGPYGGTTGTVFKWGAVDGDTPKAGRMRLLSFFGNSGAHLDGLQAVFAKDRAELVTTVRYEGLSAPEISAEIRTAVPVEGSKWFSNFTHHLMSPIITLYVGSDKVKFHAYKDTLCQLPFFSAALRGNFKEATEQAITMPEDDPSQVSALIEFLCTGNYTCTYDTVSSLLRKGSGAPVGDLRQGLFHVGINVIASKYGCPVLAAIAIKNIEVVVTELDSINALRLWQAAYSVDLRLPTRKKDLELYCDGRGLVAWVKRLFSEHREEMVKTMLEYPALSCDLLQIAISEE